ncbi:MULTISPECIES: protein translocase subunit SecF [Acidobacterium]|uniref:Protein-export membrane protein SecF n=1 Tax=Acidobacterium capsulatum (strain ATCC 51196 / DSM 11244 / BCRC 80197 / JCM 7670 / NBRC 15755 / NCIMB 13165 / 161) TaxID=240015 RepID=C1F9I3_ACIC5|nr:MULTISPECIES: protein translocase subunit SecF [Acidobacterium]ACO34036.1 protein-export membrane protein SecF [Acidobacterium capsulatum ATCC 51196]HCT62193.1 protein translocase subunit SecF [Acidobacterium sp.]
MELFHDVKIDWLGKKWYFLGFSLIFSVSGILSLLFWHHLPLDVDFSGGTVVQVKFESKPNVDKIRHATDRAGLRDAVIEQYGSATDNEVLITLGEKATNNASLDQSRAAIVQTLARNYSKTGSTAAGKLDLDNASKSALANWLDQQDPEHLGTDNQNAQLKYAQQAAAIAAYRDAHGGLLNSVSELKSVADPAVVQALDQGAYLSGFAVRNVEIVGPQVGAQLRHQALMAVLYSLAGMLIYLWFRFELIYGVAAVVAVFHDTIITIGAFSLRDMEMSLTVIAAILTLIGYSMNDTIVVFDRIRENLRMSRREPLADVVNRSINQTLSRTVLTSGLTFLTALSLFFFGGEVLHPFSFALVVGIAIGTYSSIAVAAPMLVAYQNWRAKRGKSAALPAAKKAKI